MLSNLGAPSRVPEYEPTILIGGRRYGGEVAFEVETSLGQPSDKGVIPLGRGDAHATIQFMSPRQVVAPDVFLSEFRPGMLWPPQPGTTTEITVTDVSTGVTYPVSGRGMVVDDVDSGMDGTATVSLSAPWDRLDAPLSEVALTGSMPPLADTTTAAFREIGRDVAWWFHRAFAQAGFPCAYDYASDAVLIVPMNGRGWPLRKGTIVTSTLGVGSGFYGANVESWTASAGCDGDATYLLGTPVDPTTNVTSQSTMLSSFQLTFVVDAAHAATTKLTVANASGSASTVITINADRSLSLSGNGFSLNSTVPVGVAGVPDIVTVTYVGTALTVDRNGVQEVTTVGAAPASQSRLNYSSQARGAVHSIELRAASASTPRTRVKSTSCARIEPSPLIALQASTPALVDARTGDILDALCKATLSSYTLDEYGTITVTPWNRRFGSGTQLTLTSYDDFLTKMRRSFSMRRMAATVTAKRDVANLASSIPAVQKVYEGDGGELTQAEGAKTTFIDVPDDEDWLGVDCSFTAITSSTTSQAGLGSVRAATKDSGTKDADGNPVEGDGTSQMSVQLAKITGRTYKLTESNTGSAPIFRKTPNLLTWRVGFRDVKTPQVYAFSVIKWVPETTSIATAAPASSGELVHDLGRWSPEQGPGMLLDTLAGLAGQTTFTLNDIEIAPDLRIQLGDTHQASIPELDWKVGVRVTKKKVAFTPDKGLQMWVNLIVTSSTVTGTTYTQLEDRAAYRNAQAGGATGTYADAEADSASYTTFESNPTGVIS